MLGVRTAPALLAAAGLLVLSACSGGSDEPDAADPSASSSPTGSASPSESPDGTDGGDQEEVAPDPPKAPPARGTAASREDFARFVIESWSYALSTNDASAVTSLSPKGKPCVGCQDLVEELGQRKKEGWFVDFPGVAVDKVELTSLSSDKGAWAATAKVDIPASRSYFDDGTYRNDNDAHANTDFVVIMKLVGKQYVLLSYQVG